MGGGCSFVCGGVRKGFSNEVVFEQSPDEGEEEAVGSFPAGAVVKNPPANAGDMGSSPGPGRSHMPWSN